MTLQEAIDIVTEERKEHHGFSTDIIGQAEQLLIEAGERIQKGRATFDEYYATLLPAETVE